MPASSKDLNKEYSRIDQIRNGHCREILGQSSGLKEEDEQILHAFSFSGDMSTDQILEQTRENLWKYFAYRPNEKKKGNYFLQKVSGAFQSFGKVSATYVRARNYDDQNTFLDGKSGIMERGRHYIFQLSLQRNPEETKRYVEACFGKSIYSQEYQEKIERKLCVGNHKNCHLLFTKGNLRAGEDGLKESETEKNRNKTYTGENELSKIKGKREKKEIREFQAESARQYEKNKKHYEQNYSIYQNAIRRLTEKLKICLEEQEERFPEKAAHGKLNPREVWKAVYLDDPRVFERKEEREDELFRYVAAGNNRDGLALRAAGHLMENGEKRKRILLVLTDASPQDDQDSGEGAFYKNKEYTDLLAIQDTAKEVQNLKQKGIQVIGIFMGSARSGEVAGKIFGQNLIKIRNISDFSQAVGRVLQEIVFS